MIRQVILNEKLILSFEAQGKMVRLLVSEADRELACRKETFKNLEKFLLTDQVNIFKGRLQLHKHNEVIEVVIKNKAVAIISSSGFSNSLNSIQ